jgi:hypothetical protein
VSHPCPHVPGLSQVYGTLTPGSPARAPPLARLATASPGLGSAPGWPSVREPPRTRLLPAPDGGGSLLFDLRNPAGLRTGTA